MPEAINGRELMRSISTDLREIRASVTTLAYEFTAFQAGQTELNLHLAEASKAATNDVLNLKQKAWLGAGICVTIVGLAEAVVHFI